MSLSDPTDELSALLGLPDVDDDPLCDGERLVDVLALGLHQPQASAALDALLAEVAEDLRVPVALVNGLLPDVQVLAGAHGVSGWLAEARATPVEWSLCADVVRSGEPRTVQDLAGDPTTADNPLLTVDGLQSYAGVPLRSPGGQVVGALCVLDTRPRVFSEAQVARLREAARRAVELLAP